MGAHILEVGRQGRAVGHGGISPRLPLVLALAGFVAFSDSTATAQDVDPGPADTPLRCWAADGGVLLEWDWIVWIQPDGNFAPIEGYLISRDGVEIAMLPDGTTSYFDPGAPPGSHVYVLSVINWDGTVGLLGRCEVVVPDPGLRCKADQNLVYLEWGPILIDVLILEFRVLRDGDLVAIVPPDQLSHVDAVPDIGKYGYAVEAVVSQNASFLVGKCEVAVECYGLETSVSGLDVQLSWNFIGPFEMPPIIDAVFYIHRDGDLIGETREPSYIDTVPAPGIYAYRVYVDYGTGGIPVMPIGACRVIVPGNTLPPPRDLTCTVVEPPVPVPVDPATGDANGHPEAIDADGDGVDDTFFPSALVILEWTNPVQYEKIVIARNKAIIATIPGDQTRFVDRVHGGQTYLYSVTGVRGSEGSRPALCEVDVPGGFVPPPQDFRCVLLDMILDPTDPDWPTEPGTGGVAAPFDIVLLSWWNPIRYVGLVILRDGAAIAELPGDAMMHRDIAPPPGWHVYEIYGIAATGETSPTVACEIFVGPDPVPPVQDLQCLVAATDPAITPPESVLLLWRNAARYDGIFVLRSGVLIAELPGFEESYLDPAVEPGVYVYEVIAYVGDMKSRPAACEVIIPGPPERNVLYFTPAFPGPIAERADWPVLPPVPGSAVTCTAANADPVQGWSFGVASDPKFIVPTLADLDGTVTQAFHGGAGPDFLFVEILPDLGGVVMAVIIQTDATSSTDEILPPGQAHPLLNIEYGAGPAGTPGEIYPVSYSGALGSPPVQVLYVVDGFEVVPATMPGWVSLAGNRFIRGDAVADGRLEMADAIHILSWLFLGGPEPGCMEAANANGSSDVNIADPVYILQYLYSGGPEPPFPYPRCAEGPAPLGCERHEFCELEVTPGG